MTEPDKNGGQNLFLFSPKDLILYMGEMISRLESVGNRLSATIDAETAPTVISLAPPKDKINE